MVANVEMIAARSALEGGDGVVLEAGLVPRGAEGLIIIGLSENSFQSR